MSELENDVAKKAADKDAGGAKKAGPRVAVILLWYPLFTQPFIFRDVEAIKKRLPTEVHTLYGKNYRLCSKEMFEAAEGTKRLGAARLPAILFSNLVLGCKGPLRYLRLFKKHVCRPWRNLEILGENLWAFLCGVHLAPVLAGEKVDIVYAPWPRGTCTAARVLKDLGVCGYVPAARGDNLNPADVDLADKLNEALAIRTNNFADKERIEALLRESFPGRENAFPKVEVIYNCLTLHVDKPAPLPFKAPVRLLAVGRFDVTKGFDVLLKACAILRDMGASFTLDLVGGGGKLMGLGALEDELKKLCHDLGLDDIVSFPGLVGHDAFPDLLRAHDVFVAPCVVGPNGERDGIPNTLIEAMSFGLPVVASEVAALPELVRHEQTGLLVPQRDEKTLAKALFRLIGNPDFARELGRNGERLAFELFSPEQNGERLCRFLETTPHAAPKDAPTDETPCVESPAS